MSEDLHEETVDSLGLATRPIPRTSEKPHRKATPALSRVTSLIAPRITGLASQATDLWYHAGSVSAWRITGLWYRFLTITKYPVAGRLSLPTRLRTLTASPGVSLAFLSMFVTLLVYAHQKRLFDMAPLTTLGLSILSLILLTISASLVSFYATRPSNLAELMIAGRRDNEALAALATENLLLIKRSTAFVEDLDIFVKKVRSAVVPGIPGQDKVFLRQNLRSQGAARDRRSHR